MTHQPTEAEHFAALIRTVASNPGTLSQHGSGFVQGMRRAANLIDERFANRAPTAAEPAYDRELIARMLDDYFHRGERDYSDVAVHQQIEALRAADNASSRAETVRRDGEGGGVDWETGSPTDEGIYLVRGWHLGREKDYAVVEIVSNDGTLMCNLHCENSERKIAAEWDVVEAFNQRFQWKRIADHPSQLASGVRRG